MITIQNLTVSQVFQAARYVPDHDGQVYDWSAEQVKSRVQGLVAAFFSFYERHHTMEDLENYPEMIFGSLPLRVVGEKERAFLEGHKFFITFTLLLINVHVLQGRRIDVQIDPVKLEDLFFFRKDRSEWVINPDFELYSDCLRDLIRGKEVIPEQQPRHVAILVDRYKDIDAILREELNDRALPLFAAWLKNKISMEVLTAENSKSACLLKSARAYDRLKVKLIWELTEAPDY